MNTYTALRSVVHGVERASQVANENVGKFLIGLGVLAILVLAAQELPKLQR